VENAALRAALSQAQLLPPGAGGPPQQQQQANGSANGGLQQHNNGAHLEEAKALGGVVNELKNDSAEVQDQKNE